jgi:hypothetical protein
VADVILYITAKRTMEIGQELRTMGYIQGVDFDYAYYQEKYDNFSHEPIVKRHARFTFYNDSNASYFALKWQ